VRAGSAVARAVELQEISSVAGNGSSEPRPGRDVRVSIDLDVEKNLDRAIELINDTGELNFTKTPLKKTPQKARKKLQKILGGINTQAGLIRVADNDRDYGYCGFFLTRSKHDRARLMQFCFSPEIRDMGVEHWLYSRLGRPEIEISDGVSSDLSKPINLHGIRFEEDAQAPHVARRALLCGRCSVAGLMQYFRMDSYDVVGEFENFRDSIVIRRDHSLMLRYAIEGVAPAQMGIFRELGFHEADFVTSFSDTSIEPAVRVLGNWADSQNMLWRHKETGLLVPFKLKRSKAEKKNKAANGDLPEAAHRAQTYLRENFEWVGRLPDEEAARNFDVILDALPKGSPLFVIAAPERRPEGEEEALSANAVQLNRRTMAAAERHPDKLLIPISLVDLADADERHSQRHFHRRVYHRLYQRIQTRLKELIPTAVN